jgi:hypothetical protein
MAETQKPVPTPEQEKARLAKLPTTPSTGGDLKQQTLTTGGSVVEQKEGKLASDAEKDALAEANADADVGEGDASDALGTGAIVEAGVRDQIDFEHPAVDNRPRRGLPEVSNRIDFNNPYE